MAGFWRDDINFFAVLNGKPLASKPHKGFRELSKNDIATLIDFDKRCFGWDRKKLLEPILIEKGNLCYFSVEKDETFNFTLLN